MPFASAMMVPCFSAQVSNVVACIRPLLDSCLGDDGVLIIWEVNSAREIQRLSLPFHGPICSLVWVPASRDCDAVAFAVGSSDGTVQVYRRSRSEVRVLSFRVTWPSSHRPLAQIDFDFASLTNAHDSYVEDMAYDHCKHRIATIGDGCLKVWDMDSNCTFVIIPFMTMPTTICSYVHPRCQHT